MTPLKLTLDTNCAINLFDSSSLTATSFDELSAIIRYAMSGVVQVSITTRVEDDLLKDKDEARRAEMLRILGLFPVIGSIGRWDVSSWDGGDLWATETVHELPMKYSTSCFRGLPLNIRATEIG